MKTTFCPTNRSFFIVFPLLVWGGEGVKKVPNVKAGMIEHFMREPKSIDAGALSHESCPQRIRIALESPMHYQKTIDSKDGMLMYFLLQYCALFSCKLHNYLESLHA